jgi:hypothetical protein
MIQADIFHGEKAHENVLNIGVTGQLKHDLTPSVGLPLKR